MCSTGASRTAAEVFREDMKYVEFIRLLDDAIQLAIEAKDGPHLEFQSQANLDFDAWQAREKVLYAWMEK